MLSKSPSDLPQISFFDITTQLNSSEPLLDLGRKIPWSELESCFSNLYSDVGRGAKPIRLMCGLLILKQLYNLSDEALVEQWKMNPYFQVFCGETCFQNQVPCQIKSKLFHLYF